MDPKSEIRSKEDDIIPKSKEGLQGIQGLQWQPEMYNSLLTELQKNLKFRKCIDTKLGIDENDKFMKDFKKEHFTIDKWSEDHINYIKNKIHNFESLTDSDIKECLNELSFSDKLKKDICSGNIPINLMDGFMIVLQFFDIHIDKQHINNENGKKNLDELIIQIAPLVKKIFKKIIQISETIESDVCPDNKISNITDSLKKINDTLFETRNTINYPFKDFEFDFFNDFGKTFYGKVILMIFICFIFSQMVKLFSNRGETLQK